MYVCIERAYCGPRLVCHFAAGKTTRESKQCRQAAICAYLHSRQAEVAG